jgi:hypothetical protein
MNVLDLDFYGSFWLARDSRNRRSQVQVPRSQGAIGIRVVSISWFGKLEVDDFGIQTVKMFWFGKLEVDDFDIRVVNFFWFGKLKVDERTPRTSIYRRASARTSFLLIVSCRTLPILFSRSTFRCTHQRRRYIATQGDRMLLWKKSSNGLQKIAQNVTVSPSFVKF